MLQTGRWKEWHMAEVTGTFLEPFVAKEPKPHEMFTNASKGKAVPVLN
jgi:hypothetical protein